MKMVNDESGSRGMGRRWTFSRAAVGLALVVMALGVAACGDEDSPDGQTVSPFSISARVKNSTVAQVAGTLASYIHTVDDKTRGMPDDWIVAGGDKLNSGQDALHAALKLPNGTRIVEVCNHTYAAQAMSFGGHHGVALPCEIAVNQKGSDVEVVLLNPSAIFKVFFADVPAEKAQAMGGLAATVRGELDALVAAALSKQTTDFPKMEVGPTWTPAQLRDLAGKKQDINKDIDLPASAKKDSASALAYRDKVVQSMLTTLTHEESASVGSKVSGLSVKDWRSARTHALGLPGKVSVVEVCSPTYAGAAMQAGTIHAPALPCQVAVYVKGDKLAIRVLDPQFIFSAFFSDAPAQMMHSMGPMAAKVRADILLTVDAAVQAVK